MTEKRIQLLREIACEKWDNSNVPLLLNELLDALEAERRQCQVLAECLQPFADGSFWSIWTTGDEKEHARRADEALATCPSRSIPPPNFFTQYRDIGTPWGPMKMPEVWSHRPARPATSTENAQSERLAVLTEAVIKARYELGLTDGSVEKAFQILDKALEESWEKFERLEKALAVGQKETKQSDYDATLVKFKEMASRVEKANKETRQE